MKRTLICMLLAGVLCLCGCSYTPSLKQRLIVESMAVDRQNSAYQVTLQTYAPGEEPAYRLYTGLGNSVYHALQTISQTAGKSLFFADLKAAVFSRTVLQTGLWACLDHMIRSSDFGNSVCLAATRQKASELLSAAGSSGRRPGELLYDVLHPTPPTKGTCGELMQVGADLNTPGVAAAMPLIRLQKINGTPTVETVGVLCFSGGYPGKVLTGEAMLAYRILQGYAAGSSVTVTAADQPVQLELKTVDADLSFFNRETPVFSVAITGRCVLKESLHRTFSAEELTALQNTAARVLAQTVQNALEQTAGKGQVDAFGLLGVYRQNCPAAYFAAEHPERMLSSAAYRCRASVTLVRVGQGALA